MNRLCGAIVARNGGAWLGEALGDLTAVLGIENVVVIDNDSRDGSTRALPVTVRHEPINLGYAAGANRALAWARERGAAGLLLLNQDARLDAASIGRMAAVFASDANIAAVFAKVVDHDRPFLLQGLAGRLNWRHKLTTALGEGRIDTATPAWPLVVQHGYGAALLVRVDAALAAGGFDERLFAYHEEIELCWRLRRRHYHAVLEPRAVARHRGPAGDPRRERAKAYLVARNSVLAARRNGGRLAAARVLSWALAAGILYYGPIALTGDERARAALAGWWDGLRGHEIRPAIRNLL